MVPLGFTVEVTKVKEWSDVVNRGEEELLGEEPKRRWRVVLKTKEEDRSKEVVENL